jgi:hypothetical protein
MPDDPKSYDKSPDELDDLERDDGDDMDEDLEPVDIARGLDFDDDDDLDDEDDFDEDDQVRV